VKFGLYGGSLFTLEYTVAYPLDLAVTRVTVDTSAATLKFWKSTFSTLSNVVAETGIRGLYRGYVVTVAGGLPTYASYILAYHIAKEKLAGEKEQNWVPFVSGAIADASSRLVGTPFDVSPLRVVYICIYICMYVCV
jgi:hypothetical protein